MPYPFYQNYPNYNQMMFQQQMQNMQPQQPQQIQNGGFVSAPSIDYARNYSVAPGTSVTFKIESQPIICTKTLGFSQLDQPIFEVFRLVKEDDSINSQPITEEQPVIEYLSINEADKIKQDISQLRSEIDFLREYVEIDHKGEKNEK